MASGSQNYVNSKYGLLGSDRWVNSVSVQSIMKKELKNSEVARLRYNYNNLDTNIIASYVLYKMGHKEFKNLLNEILVDKAGIENDVWLFKQVLSSKQATLTYSYYASRYDYLRIAVAMLEDWNRNTCEGQYLKSLFENRIKKIDPSDPTAWSFESNSDDGYGSTSTYGGQFHMGISGKREVPIFVMDGYGGQSLSIDFENNKIISIMAIHRDYDWKMLVHQKLK